MDMEAVLFALLRAEICGETVSDEVRAAISAETMPELYRVSKRQDLSHLIGNSLSKLGLLGQDETSRKFNADSVNAVSRHIRKSHEYHCICSTFEEAGIPFIPLKGTVVWNWYPEPWMRTSTDIDILVKPEDTDAAAQLLVDKLEYANIRKSTHDVSMFSPTGVHVELHYDLIEDTISREQEEILSRVWETATLAQGASFRYELLPALFRFYHIAHMAKHMKNGGCGIRYFLDLWLIDRNLERDKKTEEALLRQGRLTTFAAAAEKLSRVWFGNEVPDPLTDSLAEFILTGGVHGGLKNHVAIRQAKRGDKLQILRSRIFVPYDSLKYYYPVLQKHKWLYPFCQIRRWFRLVFKDDLRRSVQELKLTVGNAEEDSASVASFLSSLDLM